MVICLFNMAFFFFLQDLKKPFDKAWKDYETKVYVLSSDI